MEIWFSADTHFGHDKPFLYEPRGFTNVKDMNEAIIENWNSVVKPGDITYLLGDVMLGDNEAGIKCLQQLNGQIFIIWGNHCTDARKDLLFMDERTRHKMLGGWYAYVIKHGKQSIYLSHYPTLTANYDDKHFSQHVINLHGHTHQHTNWFDPKNPFIYHVGVDSHNCTPVHIDEIITDIRQRWDDIGQLPVPVKPDNTYPYGGMTIEI